MKIKGKITKKLIAYFVILGIWGLIMAWHSLSNWYKPSYSLVHADYLLFSMLSIVFGIFCIAFSIVLFYKYVHQRDSKERKP